MFLNKPVRRPGEGDQHFKAKIRVAKIADKYLADCYTVYEYDFEPANKLDFGEKMVPYSADILHFITVDNIVTNVLNIEIDGIKNHSSKINLAKDKARDKALARGVIFGPHDLELFDRNITVPVIVRRITAYLKCVDDTDIIGELRLDSL